MHTVVQLPENCPLLVVIVNYKTASLSINCLRSLQPEIQSLLGTRVVVVDNASGDDSVQRIEAAIAAEGWQNWAAVLPSNYNGGYAYGNNLAIRPALQSSTPPPYVLLLNPDTIVRPGAIRALVNFMEQHPDVGIAGSSFEEADGSDWSTAFRFPTILSELESGLRLGIVSKLLEKWAVVRRMTNQQCQVDWLPGASMMIRRSVFEAIGLMDEGYFLYYEETDFCLQAKRAGWSCWYVPESRVMHIAGQSTGVTVRNVKPKRQPQYVFDSRRRYFVKNYGLVYAALADAAFLAGFGLWRLRRVIQRKPDLDPPKMLQDSIQNSVFLRGGLSSQS
ncbi:glycosyltransferase family 2 protein [Leptolyngbya sp. FACHB-36]|uniref:glycosyltransferase family 2 protein n=1 Tax=Leptolyngbya sp. FACHB-36 TaxID=2692808 RepID=UPI001681BC29|nr:glycosyltransferase family 2 protein [Leptolyngbya sp. FACHB-36]MBD2022181.1 glycosyltransferase family 2 protein [Leptolyngbya sp. FACHB-36]